MTETAKIPTVLLIDDESFDQMLYKRVLARSGLVGEAISFLYADEALAYLTAPVHKVIDVIFLDINMPRMNGFEFLDAATTALGPDFAKLVVVMLTTSLESRDRERAMAYPAVRRFINKPLTVEHVAEVAALLEGLAS
jgi:CheY-like chemotaxis protein